MHNKAFKSDSQRLAVSLRSSIAKRRSHLNAALGKGQESSLSYSSCSLWLSVFLSRQFSIVGSNPRISPTVKHAKVRGLPH
ncbi:hypothetical protein EJ063_20100 [Vibrio aquaticus]|uniref:Uncharacterized protein n=1 Tax=Vibrio aquaticus TaxID=2496559 RepID=A0A3S0V0V4_9VIBR|nr:hypothetical protein EJ063_20100 [Vibrio aquaticus]